MSPAKVAAAVITPLVATVALLISTAGCGQPSPQSSKSTSQATSQQSPQSIVRHSAASCAPANGFGGANAPAVPAAFPQDFPTYPGASFAAGTQPTLTRVTVTWTTTATSDAIRAFYEKQLQSGDWQLYGEQYSDPCGAFWHVERRSNTHFGGRLSLYVQPGEGGSAFITVDLDKK
jgi:hypothetical protein